MTKRELEAEVERLRNEVAFLRSQQVAHICPQWPANLTWPNPPAQPQCTCGTSVRCHRHFPSEWSQNIWVNTGCAAGVPQTIMLNTTAAQPASYFAPTVCGGAAGVPQVLTFNIPA